MASDQARWIPIGVLPLDLQLEVLNTTEPVCRRDVRSPGAPVWLVIATVALFCALLHIAANDAVGGFGSLWRFGCLTLGSLLVARYAVSRYTASRRGLGFRAKDGPQVILGSASLVIAGTRDVRVIPAERISLVLGEVQYGKEVLFRLGGEWRWDRLQQVVDKAKADPDVRRNDRYRRAAARVRPTPRFALAASTRAAQLAGAGVALSAVVFLEAGPLDARGERNRVMALDATAVAQAAETTIQGRYNGIVTADQVMARRKRESLLKSALEGKQEDARAFIMTYGPSDEARPSVQARLRELCAAEGQGPAFDPKTRVLRAMLRGACETPRATINYSMTGGDRDTDVASTFMESLAASAAKLSAGPRVAVLEVGSPSGYPYVRLTMRRSPAQQWSINVEPLDAEGRPAAGAVFPWNASQRRAR